MESCKFLHEDGFLQYFIYYMNDPNVRNAVVEKFFRNQKQFKWWGTFYLSGTPQKMVVQRNNDAVVMEPLHDFFDSFQKKLRNNKINIYTLCYEYDGNRVHYISDLYDATKKQLIHFDPGISLYDHGQKTIIPTWEKQYRKYKLVGKSKEIGTCNTFRWRGKKTGVQYDKSDSFFPADSFCQTWTIFFFYRLSLAPHDLSFVTRWCKIPPPKRKLFLLCNFILPFLIHKKKYYRDICKMMGKKICHSLPKLYTVMEECFSTA